MIDDPTSLDATALTAALQPREALLAQAHAADAALARGDAVGPLHGLPIAVKDLCDTAGIVTTHGSTLFAGHVPERDALLVQRPKAARAIVLGKTTTPEWGPGPHTYNPVHGITRNAWNPALAAGGSSGGAAVALAPRLLPLVDGSDMMGSLRNPAGWHHVFGLRPSQGRERARRLRRRGARRAARRADGPAAARAAVGDTGVTRGREAGAAGSTATRRRR